MPYALIGIGLILIITGTRDTYAQLGAQLRADFTGQRNFTIWVLALGGVGALGYVKELRTFSTLFMTLIIIAMFLANQGFFQKFSAQWAAGPVAPKLPVQSTTPSADAPPVWFDVPKALGNIGSGIHSGFNWLGM